MSRTESPRVERDAKICALSALADRFDSCGPGEYETRDWWGEARVLIRALADAHQEAVWSDWIQS